LAKEDLVAGVLDTVPFYTAMEDTAVLLELFRKRLDVLNRRMEILQQFSAPLKAPPPPPLSPSSLLRLQFEVRLQIYHCCIPRKYVIEVSDPRFYIRWPFEEKNHTVDLKDALLFNDDTLDLEDDTLDLEGTLELGFEDDMENLEAEAVYSGATPWIWRVIIGTVATTIAFSSYQSK
jgi:hypothetical protein